MRWAKRQGRAVDSFQAATCGSAAGAFAAVLTTPLDLVKTRQISRQAALNKYLPRVFSSEDLERGWHGNRVSIQAGGLEAYFEGRGTDGKLHCLSSPEATNVDRSSPQRTHFWEWSST